MFSKQTKFLFNAALTVILAIGLPYLSIVAANAWDSTQSAQTVCGDLSTAYIDFSLTNSSSDKSVGVTVTDSQTGMTEDLSQIKPGATIADSINTGRQRLSDGTLTFTFSWSDNSPDDREIKTIGYKGINCADSIPTDTPTPFPTSTPTPQPTATPTLQPSITSTPDNNNTNTCNNSTQTGNNNANNNCNSNNNTNNNDNNNNNSNSQDQNQTQNNNQSVNITINNPQPTVIQEVLGTSVANPSSTKSLPSTGAGTDVLITLLSLIPVGIKLRKLA